MLWSLGDSQTLSWSKKKEVEERKKIHHDLGDAGQKGQFSTDCKPQFSERRPQD